MESSVTVITIFVISATIAILCLVYSLWSVKSNEIGKRLSLILYLNTGQIAVLAGLGFAAFAVLGLSFQVLLQGCLNVADPGLFTCIVWITASWLISFFTPGAPAGIGVREFILVSLISVDYGQSLAVESALAFRGISVLGDSNNLSGETGFCAGELAWLTRGITGYCLMWGHFV